MVAKRGLSPSLSKCVLFRGKTLDKSLTDNKWGVFYDTEAGFGLCHAICDGKAADLQRQKASLPELKWLRKPSSFDSLNVKYFLRKSYKK